MATDPDLLVEELVRARRDRRVLVLAAVIGIVAGVTLGMAMFLGAIGVAVEGDRPSNHAALAAFVVPVATSLTIGYGVYSVRQRRRRKI